ncbi:HMCT-like protein [Mya arenaria]|uniref:HMCT-like protein n=1 Tax=Mya arenaria TaxID=6604 RepID=A0ABY7EMD3_MYAAR|nr:hemocytin-like [Mya arenaria]WAR09961.1 HMCT-like protein [Mya arenaria]
MSFIFLEILVLSLIATKAESKDNFRAKVYTGKEVTTSNSSTLGVSLIQCQNMCVLARRKGTSNICGYDKVSKTCFYSFDTEHDVLSTSEVTKVVLIPIEDACQSSEYLVNGMEPVLDDQITASSVYNEAHDTRGSRLDSVPTSSHVGAWKAGKNDTNQYIQVQFNCPNHVIGVAMQGRPVSTDPNAIVGVDCCYQRVTAYKLLYSGDCVNFLTIRDSGGSDVIFDGNTDQDTVVTSMLPSPVTALCVRINPVTWFGGYISLRFDILGCSMNEQQHSK